MASKKKAVAAIGKRDAANLRVVREARRWAKMMRELGLGPRALPAPSHHLLVAVRKLEELEEEGA